MPELSGLDVRRSSKRYDRLLGDPHDRVRDAGLAVGALRYGVARLSEEAGAEDELGGAVNRALAPRGSRSFPRRSCTGNIAPRSAICARKRALTLSSWRSGPGSRSRCSRRSSGGEQRSVTSLYKIAHALKIGCRSLFARV